MTGGTGSAGADDVGLTGAAALRQPDFRLFFFGKFFSNMAHTMITVAIGYQIYDRTGDPMDLAYIGLATFAPALGLALFTGYVADRFDRRFVLVLCYVTMLGASILLFVYTIADVQSVWPAFFIISVMGTGRAFYQPASNALVPNLVPPAVFPNAVAWNTGANKVSSVVGPAIGGGLYLAGPEIVYAVAAVSFVIGALLALAIRTRTQRTGKEPLSIRTLLAGLGYVYEKKVIFGAITLDLFVVILGGVTALLPVYAKDILNVGAAGAGGLRSAMAVGAVVMALLMTQVAISRGVGRLLFAMVTIFGIATIVFGVSTSFWLSMAAMAVIGGSDMISVYIRSTILQIATPDAMRGRVSAVNSVFTGASNEVGEFRAGVMAAVIGAMPAVVFGGVGSIIVAAIGWKVFPALRTVERMDRNL